ncbi:hypothetical protein PHPALM_30934 [Phytophthora palmivora]|uniref:Uncharacterized protein n=1 Tax=Phytophthora palmivora TaxID=4796 RepID=A0A2P4X3X0_9STRA|nr:hypothetical protein PHPALM_30934 [Phytophthora palmivora]
MFLEKIRAFLGRTSRGAYERALVQNETLFVEGIEAARCVPFASYRIHLKEFTSLQKPVVRSPSCGEYDDPYSDCSGGKNITVQELKETPRRSLEVLFPGSAQSSNQVRAKRQLYSVMDGLKQQTKSTAHDERGCGSTNPGIVHCKVAKKLRTTVVSDLRSQQSSGSLHGAGLRLQRFLWRGIPSPLHRHLVPPLLDDTLDMEVDLSVPIKEGKRSPHTCLSTKLLLSLFFLDPQLRKFVVFEIACTQLRLPVGLNLVVRLPPSCRIGGLEDVWELHGRVDRRVPASALKELRRGLDALSHEVHGYSFHSAYGYGSYGNSSSTVPSYSSYESRGYQPVFHSQAPTPANPVVHETRTQFEEVSSRLGLPPSEKKDSADHGTA